MKFFNLLEEAAHNIDLAFAEKNGETISNVFTNIRARIKVLHLSIEDKEQKIELVKDAAANAILAQPENEKVIRDIYEPRLKHLNEQIVTKLKEVETLKNSSEYKEPGPCEKVLDDSEVIGGLSTGISWKKLHR